jgi:hypothetical protein
MCRMNIARTLRIAFIGGVAACSSSNAVSPPTNSDAGAQADAGPPPSADAAAQPDSGPVADSGPPATFTQVYTNIISQRCAPCHTTASGIGVAMGKLDMTSQATAYGNLVNAPAVGSACAGKGTRITPGQPDQSIMYLKVSLDDPTPCGQKMPLGGPPLTKDQADSIESWVTAGAQNN